MDRLNFKLGSLCILFVVSALVSCGTFVERDQSATAKNVQLYRIGFTTTEVEAALEKIETAKCKHLRDEIIQIPDAGFFDGGSTLQSHRENAIVSHVAKTDGNLAIEKMNQGNRFSSSIKIYICPPDFLKKVKQINEMTN